MGKPLIVDEAEGSRFPFLRGILTRSLQSAGLTFDDAYRLATTIRASIADRPEVPRSDLRALVLERLEPFGQGTIARYLRPPAPPAVLIRFPDGHTSPFSRGRHRMALRSCGLGAARAAEAATRVAEILTARRTPQISFPELQRLTHDLLAREVSAEAARQYVVREQFQQSDRPLLLLIGGTVGSGKSTIATQLANRLGIVRTQSSDMLREVMRMMVPERLVPILHVSSFQAWEKLASPETADEDPDAKLISGYLTQAELLAVACEAVIHRALQERVSLILEGVNMHPSFLPNIAENTDAVVVRAMLGVLSPKQLKTRIRGRGSEAPGRRAKRYLEHFDAIWQLQSFLLSEADRVQVPIVANEDLDEAVEQLMTIVMSDLARSFSGSAEEVFK